MTTWVDPGRTIDVVRVAVAIGGLAFASWTDLRKREVPDGLWYALAAVALALSAYDFDMRFGGVSWILVLAVAAVFAVAVTGGEILTVVPGDAVPEEPIEYTDAQKRIIRVDMGLSLALLAGAAAVFVVAPSLDLGDPGRTLDGPEAQAYATCLMLGAALLFYFMGALHGGADAKGFMVLALLFPVAPALPGLPLVSGNPLAVALIPFALIVLFNGALMLVVAGPVAFMAIGAKRGKLRFPHSLVGYEKSVARVNLSREFVMGSVRDGTWRPSFMVFRGTHSEGNQREALDFLKASGVPAVFVSPKAPFMVYMLLGLVMAVVASSPLHWV